MKTKKSINDLINPFVIDWKFQSHRFVLMSVISKVTKQTTGILPESWNDYNEFCLDNFGEGAEVASGLVDYFHVLNSEGIDRQFNLENGDQEPKRYGDDGEDFEIIQAIIWDLNNYFKETENHRVHSERVTKRAGDIKNLEDKINEMKDEVHRLKTED
tara:strand:- start:390 stop:863 length:474 start_codon:yes stop_codon:yes gene_type:complete